MPNSKAKPPPSRSEPARTNAGRSRRRPEFSAAAAPNGPSRQEGPTGRDGTPTYPRRSIMARAIGSEWDSFRSVASALPGRRGTLTYSLRSAVLPTTVSEWDSFGSGVSTVLGRHGTPTYPSRSAVTSALVSGWDSSWAGASSSSSQRCGDPHRGGWRRSSPRRVASPPRTTRRALAGASQNRIVKEQETV